MHDWLFSSLQSRPLERRQNIAARIIHIDNEEKKKIRRLREEQARATMAALPRDDNDEEDHFDD